MGNPDSGLIAGGSIPRLGEVSLAHHAILFLDELTQATASSSRGQAPVRVARSP
jgi:Magnesium chelatase, subunit ChlI